MTTPQTTPDLYVEHHLHYIINGNAITLVSHPKFSIPEMSPADTPSLAGYVTSAPSSKNNGVVAPRKADAAQNRTNKEPPEEGMMAAMFPIGSDRV